MIPISHLLLVSNSNAAIKCTTYHLFPKKNINLKKKTIVGETKQVGLTWQVKKLTLHGSLLREQVRATGLLLVKKQ